MRSLLAAAIASVASIGLSATSQGGGQVPPEQVYRPGPGVTDPTLIRQEPPKYPSDAMRAKIQGVVEVEAVVLTDGTVGDVRVIKSLDITFGLDAEAIAAAKRWQFKPGTYNGLPVPVIVTLLLEFKMYPGEPRTPADDFLEGTYWIHTPGLVMPKLKTQVQPKCTAAARGAKLQGVVMVEAVVMADGTVGRSRVGRSLDPTFGLDTEALKAVNQWTFEPARLQDQAVPVIVVLTLEFKLK